MIWMLHNGRARHPGPGKCFLLLVSCRSSLSTLGGWLTYGDLAVDSCAQFLAEAEQR